MPKSELEDALLFQIAAAELPPPIREYRFAEIIGRWWRFDLCWPDRMIAVEVEGFGHHKLSRYIGDIDKYNAAIELGYRLYRVTGKMVKGGRALTLIERVLNAT